MRSSEIPARTFHDNLARASVRERGQSAAFEETSAAVRHQAKLRGRISKEAGRGSIVSPSHVIDCSRAQRRKEGAAGTRFPSAIASQETDVCTFGAEPP